MQGGSRGGTGTSKAAIPAQGQLLRGSGASRETWGRWHRDKETDRDTTKGTEEKREEFASFVDIPAPKGAKILGRSARVEFLSHLKNLLE